MHRARAGALLGGLVGPPLLILAVYPFLYSRLVDSSAGDSGSMTATGGVTLIVATIGAWGVGVLGLPLLGASLATGKWIGPELARRLINHCIGGAFAGGVVATVALRVLPGMGGGGIENVLRLAMAEVGLAVGIVLCFRSRKPGDTPAG